MSVQSHPFRLTFDAAREPGASVFHMRAPATLHNAARCVEAMHVWLDLRSPGSRDGFHAALIVDELVHNIAMHGQGREHRRRASVCFSLWVEHGAQGIRIALHDTGARFDPLAAHTRHGRSATLDDPVGGLGITLLRTLLHAAHYQYCAGENRLRLFVPPHDGSA
ncbi:ATP-binding protein [Robbsia sp. KACC 23696]|uniref:ATP-binding protein n=1 Tax=Robbsia sp. KACC 23696 TaxID=3149231 RepID=UPI00325A7505